MNEPKEVKKWRHQISKCPLKERPLAGALLDDGHVQPEDGGTLVAVVGHALLHEGVDLDELLLRLDVTNRQVLKWKFDQLRLW